MTKCLFFYHNFLLDIFSSLKITSNFNNLYNCLYKLIWSREIQMLFLSPKKTIFDKNYFLRKWKMSDILTALKMFKEVLVISTFMHCKQKRTVDRFNPKWVSSKNLEKTNTHWLLPPENDGISTTKSNDNS